MNTFPQKRRLWQALFLTGLLLPAHNVLAASDTAAQIPEAINQDKLIRGSPPDIVKPGVPSKAESVESAFRKLDPTRKGYVTKADAQVLEGFDTFFDKVDVKRTGKLNYAQFKKAWNLYALNVFPKPAEGVLVREPAGQGMR